MGVDWNDTTANADEFIKQHHLTYPILRDGSSAVGERFGLTGLPTTLRARFGWADRSHPARPSDARHLSRRPRGRVVRERLIHAPANL